MKSKIKLMRSWILPYVTQRVLTLVFAVGLLLPFTMAFAQNVETQEITRFTTINGLAIHYERPSGQGVLNFPSTGQNLVMPMQWKNTNVESSFALDSQSGNKQTAVVISHTTDTCTSALDLVVVTNGKAQGPYRLGECADSLAFQRSTDHSQLVAIRADGKPGSNFPLAWVYDAEENNFYGPARIDLPPSLASLTTTPATHENTKPKKVSHKVATQPIEAQSNYMPMPPQNAIHAPTPPAGVPGAFTAAEASGVGNQARRSTRAQRQVMIDLT